ncbi:MAG: hypothetical protein ACRD3V_11880 [Vicinamibacteria bacterium]
MARKTILLSDLTGAEIEEAATVRIFYPDSPREEVVLDVDAAEVADLADKGRVVSRRGRPRGER